MRITENIYQLTGHITGLNSNTFAIDTEQGIVLIDTGYREYYIDVMKKMLHFWKLDKKKIIAVFITHAHFDHSGNAHYFEEQGIPVFADKKDAEAMETGGPLVMEDVFGTKYTTCHAVKRIANGDEFNFRSTKITAISLPGHTRGSMGYLAEHKGLKTLFLGDLCMDDGTSPSDDLQVEIGYTGSVDFDQQANLNSFKKLTECDADIIAPGHKGVLYGNSEEFFKKVYCKAMKEAGRDQL